MRFQAIVFWTALLACHGAMSEEARKPKPVKVGVILSTTGPAAAFGIPEKYTVQLAEAVQDGNFNFVILDDASDPTNARKSAERLIAEEHVDVIIGSSTTPSSLAMIDAVAKGEVAMVSVASSARIVEPMDEKRRWVFKASYNDSQLSDVLVNYMKKSGVKTAGYIGFGDAYGESWAETFNKATEKARIKIVVSEQYNPRDTSVLAQALKIMAAKPDAVLIGASGTPAILPQSTLIGRGYKGAIYQTSGSANADFIRSGGRDVEGTILPCAPVLVAEQLGDDHPSKNAARLYKSTYEKKYGAGSVTVFGANTWDAILLVKSAAERTRAQGISPGSREFRVGLRDNLEKTTDLPGSLGTASFDPTRHSPYTNKGPILVTVKNGAWLLVQ